MSENIGEKLKFKFWFGIVLMFLLATVLHFVYDWSGGNKFLGLFFPVNESVWEHLKLLILPITLWWIIIFKTDGQKLGLDRNRWTTGCLVSLVSAMLFTVAFYYTYTQAFGFESVALDILDTLLSITFGQIVGMHIYKHSKGINALVAETFILLIVIMFVVFTLYPPNLPIFYDKVARKYGM